MASTIGNDAACFSNDSESVRPSTRSQALIPNDWTGDNPCDSVYPRHMNAISNAITALKNRTSVVDKGPGMDLNMVAPIGAEKANVNGLPLIYSFGRGQSCLNSPDELNKSRNAFLLVDSWAGFRNRSQVIFDTIGGGIYMRSASISGTTWTWSDWVKASGSGSGIEVIDLGALTQNSDGSFDCSSLDIEDLFEKIDSAMEQPSIIAIHFSYINNPGYPRPSYSYEILLLENKEANSGQGASGSYTYLRNKNYECKIGLHVGYYSISITPLTKSSLIPGVVRPQVLDWTSRSNEVRNLYNELDVENYNLFLINSEAKWVDANGTAHNPTTDPDSFFYTLANPTEYLCRICHAKIDLNKCKPYVAYEIQINVPNTYYTHESNSYHTENHGAAIEFMNTSGWKGYASHKTSGENVYNHFLSNVSSIMTDNADAKRIRFVVDESKNLYWIIY